MNKIKILLIQLNGGPAGLEPGTNNMSVLL